MERPFTSKYCTPTPLSWAVTEMLRRVRSPEDEVRGVELAM